MRSVKMNKKGFSLIELLAVIAILSIVALIITPIVIGSLNNAKEKTFLDNAINLKKAADNYYLEKDLINEKIIPLLVTYSEGKASYCNNRPKLTYSGKNPYSGNIYIDNDGKIEMRIYDNKTGKCAIKTKEDKAPHLEKTTKNECILINKVC